MTSKVHISFISLHYLQRMLNICPFIGVTQERWTGSVVLLSWNSIML